MLCSYFLVSACPAPRLSFLGLSHTVGCSVWLPRALRNVTSMKSIQAGACLPISSSLCLRVRPRLPGHGYPCRGRSDSTVQQATSIQIHPAAPWGSLGAASRGGGHRGGWGREEEELLSLLDILGHLIQPILRVVLPLDHPSDQGCPQLSTYWWVSVTLDAFSSLLSQASAS